MRKLLLFLILLALPIPAYSANSIIGALSAYGTVDNEGSALTQRGTLNFIGSIVDCVDNAGSVRTDCTVTAPSIGGVLTSVTSGAVLFGESSAFQQDATQLFYDNSGNNLGVGTFAPIAKLDVRGQVSSSSNFGINGTSLLTMPSSTTVALGQGATAGSGSTNSVYIGDAAGQSAITGDFNVAIGDSALGSAGNASANHVVIGYQAGMNMNATAQGVVAIGYQAMDNGYSSGGVAIGQGALGGSSLTGASNIAIGQNAGSGLTNGGSNVLIGHQTGIQLTTGGSNVFIGQGIASQVGTSGSIFIGSGTAGSVYGSNTLVMDNNSSATPFIFGNMASSSTSYVNFRGNVGITTVGIGTFAPAGALVIMGTGNVGIGTSTPGQKLDLGGTGDKLRMRSADGTVWNCAPANGTGIFTCT